MMKNSIKLQILTGMTGVGLLLFFWKAAAPLIGGSISDFSIKVLNVFALLSLTLPPLMVAASVKDKLSDYGFSQYNLPQQLALGIGIGLGMAGVLTLLPMLLLGKDSVYTGRNYTTVTEAIGGLAYFVLIVGLSEEFIFRGFLYTKLDNDCISDAVPILLTSVLFGLYHFSGVNLMQVLITGLIGAFFCICRKKIPGCTILSLAIAHGIHDWMIRLLASLL